MMQSLRKARGPTETRAVAAVIYSSEMVRDAPAMRKKINDQSGNKSTLIALSSGICIAADPHWAALRWEDRGDSTELIFRLRPMAENIGQLEGVDPQRRFLPNSHLIR